MTGKKISNQHHATFENIKQHDADGNEYWLARELAPLAGHYPALKLGPAWWFHDSPEGMRRFRDDLAPDT